MIFMIIRVLRVEVSNINYFIYKKQVFVIFIETEKKTVYGLMFISNGLFCFF